MGGEKKESKRGAETARDTMRELHREKGKERKLLLLMKRSQAYTRGRPTPLAALPRRATTLGDVQRSTSTTLHKFQP